ncbi:hypothetical protein [Paenibacillus sacheonensis]|uniref:Uncharacterized protein n=1 Tax=Paenibacillus sacheonensis TaxID=742054 RepID=A0A7X4YPQ4_9BACL|nr:hypothetical protein [Paenibacillus sacheonensis]MBM7565020.1 hypothetical protein [Paenibacillus sacheonensis]NBC70195.1 hypothetical protein [Paenibacillus sacheonensis]
MKVKIIVVLLLAISIFSIWYLTPKRYAKTIDGVYYQLGREGIIEPIRMHLDGKLQHHINGKKSFQGKVVFEGKQLPRLPKDVAELELYYGGENFTSLFASFQTTNAEGRKVPELFMYGSIYINDDFNAFTVKLIANDDARPWSESGGFMITAPAANRAEATMKSEQLIKDFNKKSLER